MKKPCPDCGRVVGVSNTNRMYAHNVPNGNTRCRGGGKAPIESAPATLAEVFGELAPEPSLGTEVTTILAPGSPPPVRQVLVAPGTPVPFQVGDRVMKRPDGPRGVVTAIDSVGMVFCHWGTTMIRDPEGNQIENRFEGWVSPHELKLSEEPVFFGTDGENNRSKLWDPKERPGA